MLLLNFRAQYLMSMNDKSKKWFLKFDTFKLEVIFRTFDSSVFLFSKIENEIYPIENKGF